MNTTPHRPAPCPAGPVRFGLTGAAPPAESYTMIEEARVAAQRCCRCDLCEAATQTVWGEGPANAALMIVGEQPGDQEDLSGRPFVGPAGTLLRQLMAEAGLDVASCYLTNAVKHFKFIAHGRRRMHQTPNRSEIDICRWWVETEVRLIQPRLILALGASAALSVTGNAKPLKARRGTVETSLFQVPTLISWHPSYILRLRDADEKLRTRQQLTADLTTAAQRLAAP